MSSKGYGTSPKVKLLDPEDIYDFYACEFMLSRFSEGTEEYQAADVRISEVHQIYRDSVRSRILAEAKYCGIKLPEDGYNISIEDILGDVAKALTSEFSNQADSMLRGGQFNLGGFLAKQQIKAGIDMKGVDLGRLGMGEAPKVEKKKTEISEKMFQKGGGKNSCMFDNPKWAIIAKAFVDLDKAETTADKIRSVDYLNDLQHNSFHILIDLQSGRMLEDKSVGAAKGDHNNAQKVVAEVLDIKKDAKSPAAYIAKMSQAIRTLYNKNKALLGV